MLFIHYLGDARRKAGQGVYSITLDNKVSQISRLAGFIEEIAGDNELDSGLAMSLNLALEEAVTNVVLYAYPQGTAGTVEVSAKAHGGKLTFTLSDSGTPFDPTQVPDADTNAPLEERRIGGLGIHLVRNIMDSVKYEYSEGKNILTMIKNI
jgi:anti-sigma regulatory factor (Ser/Thr protein kinase)